MTGVLLVDKPEGMTSAGVIRMLKPRLGRTKIGHLGTLDPFASGLLPLCLGEATKVARYLLAEHKVYEGTIR
ncbi:MAG TPA: tRNA pseudouridine(55) synthase TruB, partial [Candidatus Binatia bacterium]|nr:tRNA pseudouridine(55) synthase TruB [Candidatus Binatia bacterium]